MSLLQLFALIILFCLNCSCYRFCYRGRCKEIKLKNNPFTVKTDISKGTCKNPGYIPGGAKPNIIPIKSVIDAGPPSALASMVGVVVKESDRVSTGLTLSEATRLGGKKFLKYAPKLAESLGLFGAGAGLALSLADQTDPLDVVKAAISKLTVEVNGKLEDMKNYIDYKVIKLEKDLINKQYRTLWNVFMVCIKKRSASEVNKCMEDAELKISTSSPSFMMLDNYMSSYISIQATDPQEIKTFTRSYIEQQKSRAPSINDVKRIEAGLLNFRDYANLHMIVLATLVNTFKGATTGTGKASYRQFLQDERGAAKKYAAYAEWALAWVKMRNYKENYQVEPACGRSRTVHEGLALTHHRIDCKIQCTLLVPKACEYSSYVRADGKTPSGYARKMIPTRIPNDDIFAVEQYGKISGKEICKKFLDSFGKDIDTYWSNTLDTSINVWKEIGVKATNDLNALPTGDTVIANKKFSKDFYERLAIAREEAEKYQVAKKVMNKNKRRVEVSSLLKKRSQKQDSLHYSLDDNILKERSQKLQMDNDVQDEGYDQGEKDYDEEDSDGRYDERDEESDEKYDDFNSEEDIEDLK